MTEVDGALRHFVEEFRLLMNRDPIEGFRRWATLHTELAVQGHFDICDDLLAVIKGMDLPGYGLGILRYAEGWALDRSGDWEHAIERYEASLRAFNSVNIPLHATILTQIGSLYQDQGRFDEAQHAFEQALGHAEGHALALVLNNLGGLHALRDQNAEAREYFEQAKILLEQTDDRYNLAAVLVGLASLARDDGELQESVNHLASAVVIFRDLGRATAMATAVASLALTYYTAGRFPEAAETYRTALAIFVAHKDRGNIARTLANLALTSAAAGDKQQAVRYLEQALAEYDEIGDQHGAAIALENLRKLTE